MDCYRLPCWINRRQPTGFGVGVSSISSKWPQFSHLLGCGWWHFMLLPSNPILRVAATGSTTHAGPPREYAKRGSRKIQFSTQQQRYKKMRRFCSTLFNYTRQPNRCKRAEGSRFCESFAGDLEAQMVHSRRGQLPQACALCALCSVVLTADLDAFQVQLRILSQKYGCSEEFVWVCVCNETIAVLRWWRWEYEGQHFLI